MVTQQSVKIADIADPHAERVRLIIPTTGSQWASLIDVRNAPSPTSALRA
jgi:hypothetical protein